jgi:formamidase
LVVEIQDVQPFAHRPWGFCAIFDKHNGGGFLDEEYPQAAKGLPPPSPSLVVVGS